MNKVIIIYGPTAVGKSDVAIGLAKLINAEIISADSMQIYKDLNIGSAKITEQEMDGVCHHLLDIRDSLESYSAYNFSQDCKSVINEIQSKGKNVIICGGTGLYIKTLTENYDCGETHSNSEFRKNCEKFSNEELYTMLCELDKSKAKTIHQNNRHRVIRALEIVNSQVDVSKTEYNDDFVIFGLVDDREKLYSRINSRVDKMIKLGLVDEVRYLLNKGATPDHQSMKAIGYKELLPYLSGEETLENCIEKIKQHTRNYAKRQLTFMNQFPNIIKVNAPTKQKAIDEIFNIIKENKWIN